MKKKKVSDRAVEYILTRKIEDLGGLTGVEIAAAVGVKPSYLSRKFKSDQKIALDDFITREKIHTALYMLEENREMSIEELAGKLGYMELDSFITVFKNYIAVEPERYKELRYS